jgi:hypothetical protein
MFSAKAQKISRYLAGPLVLLWLLCQSMLLCAGLLSMQPMHMGSQVLDSGSMMANQSHHMNQGMSHPSSDTSAHVHALGQDQGGDALDENCCDNQENVLSNSFYGSIAFLLFFPLYWLVVSLNTLVRHFTNHKEPPPRYNYPRNHVFNCTFLN